MVEARKNRSPSVVVSELDVVYRVYGARPRNQSFRDKRNERWRRLIGQKPTTGVREIHAVKNVSFMAHHGESIGIIGRNGSGKSTLLRSVAGLIPPTRGAVYVSGRAALLGVNAVLMRQLSGRRNIMIGAQALGMTREQAEEAVDDIVEFADIGEFIDLPMSAYSSGMAARLRFAISTAAVPDVLMVDEALSTGDAAFRERSRDRIEEIRKAAGTVFFVSHNASTVREICTRALWMDKGMLVMDGGVEEVLDAYKERYPSKKKKKKNFERGRNGHPKKVQEKEKGSTAIDERDSETG